MVIGERGEPLKKITIKKSNSIRFFSTLLLFSILTFGLVFVHPVHAVTPTVSVYPSTVTASAGQNFSIDIRIANVFDLYGWEFRLGWNSTLLDAVNVTEGTFLKQGGNTFFANKTNNTEGYVLVDCTLLGAVPGVSGSGTLATVEFHAEVPGQSVLDLYNTILINPLEQPIPHTANDGNVTTGPSHDVAVISIASPTTVLLGQAIHINVTVQNQGGYAESFNVTVYYNSTVIEKQSVSLDIGASTNLTFTWNTTGINKGDYTISAEASVVPGETDTTDNTKVADSMVTVLSLGHDVAVKGVTPSKTVVGRGYPLSIYITAKNYGTFTETFNVTSYANSTIIQTQNVALASGNSTTITFTWNTTGVSCGNYTIGANATIVPGETYTADNTYTDGWVVVTVVGDVDGSGRVEWGDLGLLGLAYGSTPASPNWNPNADFDASGKVDWGDLGTLGLNYGKSCS